MGLVVNLALIAAIEVAVIAFACMVVRSDWAVQGPATVLFVALALGLATFVAWGTVVFAAALYWNRRAARLTGETEPPGLREPRGPGDIIESQLRGVAIFATVAFFQFTYWDVALELQQAQQEVPPDFGQGAGLFWMLLLFLTAGLAPIMRWSISATLGFRTSFVTAYKAAYAGLLLAISIFLAVSLAVVKVAPSIADLPMTVTWKKYTAGALIAAFLAHAVVGGLVRTPNLRRAGIARGATIAAVYVVICSAIGATVWCGINYRDEFVRFVHFQLA